MENTKKTYQTPLAEKVEIDQEISLIMSSAEPPEDPWGSIMAEAKAESTPLPWEDHA